MTASIVWEFTQSFCVLFSITFVFSKLKIIKKHLTSKPLLMREKLILSLLFGILGSVGSIIGIEFNGSLINTRVIGVAMGGIIGGPFVGIISGIIAGLHRVFFVDAGKTTAIVCSCSMIIEGVFAGYLSRYSDKFRSLASLSTFTVVLCELFRKLMLLCFIRPFPVAQLLVRNITVPMLIINSLGVGMFVTYIETVSRENDIVKARQSEMVLSVTEKIAAAFRQGLVKESLSEVVTCLCENTEFTHVMITDFAVPIVSNIGGDELSRLTLPINELSKYAMSPDGGCYSYKTADLYFLAVPLVDDENVTGFLCLGKAQPPGIYDIKLADGLGKLFSTQLTIGNLSYQSSLLKDAEIRVLQAQINPHFLFNTMSAISALCRTDPTGARRLIDKLADFYRKNLRITSQMVALEDELNHIDSYLEIMKTRYGNRIEVIYDVDKPIDCFLPPLSLQPLVENCVKHGLLPKADGGVVSIRAKKNTGSVMIEVEDNGQGFDSNAPGGANSNFVGLKNVEKRLRNCFGAELSWKVDTERNRGTKITIVIPAVLGA